MHLIFVRTVEMNIVNHTLKKRMKIVKKIIEKIFQKILRLPKTFTFIPKVSIFKHLTSIRIEQSFIV